MPFIHKNKKDNLNLYPKMWNDEQYKVYLDYIYLYNKTKMIKSPNVSIAKK